MTPNSSNFARTSIVPRLFGGRLAPLALALLGALLCIQASGQYMRHPEAGDVFRDHRLANTGNSWRVTDPNALQPRAIQTLPNEVYGLLVGDLEGATRAELIIDYWGGHPGTDLRHVRLNANDWLELPDLVTGTPNPNCYLQLVNFAVDIPLSHLVEGINTLEGLSGGQVCYNFNWGMWGMYGMVLRVYYDPELKDHPTGGIARPAPGSVITDDPLILVNASSNVGIERVDFIAHYNGYDPDGDGRFTDWQLSYRDGAKLKDHIGSDTTIPYRRRWNTNLVPDQPAGSVKIRSYITDNDGYTYVTEDVEGLTLERTETSVRLYRMSGIPENFLTRDHETNELYFTIPKDDDLSTVETAFLFVRSWNGLDPKTTTRVNSWISPLYGRDHKPDFDRLGMGDGSALKNGMNVFSITNTEEEEHGPEILWPGPAVIVRYNSGPRKPTVFPALYGFDNEAGPTVKDLTNNGNDGVLEGNVTRTDKGRYGSGVQFDGASGHVDLGVIDFPGEELTVSMWAYIDSEGTDPNARLFSKAIGTRLTEGQLIVSLNLLNGIRYRLATSSGIKDLITYNSLDLDSWNHVAVTYDGSAMRVYVNGIPRKTETMTGTIDNGSNVPVWVGDNPGGERRTFHGRIDEVRVYNIAQSTSQILTDMETSVLESDLTPPTIPSFLTAALDTKTSATLNWEESMDESKINGYRIYRDGVQVGFSNTNSHTEYELFPNRTFSYTVTAIDEQGNESAQSNSASVTTPPDLQPPTTPNSLTAEASAFSASLSWNTAYDDTAISHYRIYRNGREVASSTSTNYSDSGLDVETTYTYQVMAVDTIGNFSGLSNRVIVTTLAEPPNPTLLLGYAFEEISGGLALDSSGYRYDGKITSGVTRSEAGKVGRSIRFGGAGGSIDVGTMDIPGTEVTIGAWIKPDDFGVKDARIISKATGQSDNQHYWMLSTVNTEDGIKFRARLKTSSGRTKTLIGATTVKELVWTHVAFTYDGELMRLYVNGVLDAALEHVGEIARNSRVPTAVGNQPQGGKNFDGLIDELQIHTLVKSEEEVRSMMNERLPGPGGANLPPTITRIPDQVIFANTSTEVLPFTIGDESTAPEDLEVSVRSSNTSVVPRLGIVLQGEGASRSITVTPIEGKTGSANITVEVSDGDDVQEEVFAVMVVTPGNTPPTISKIADQNVVLDSSSDPIAITVGDGETPVGQLTLSAESTNLDLLPINGIKFGGADASRTVTITPKVGEVGNSRVTISVSDGEFSISRSLIVTVNPPVSETLWLGMPFEEGFGSAAFDVSENKNDGTLAAGVSRSEEGQIGRSLVFSGGGGFVDLGNLDIPGSGLTIAAWIYAESFAVPDARIISKANGADEGDHFWMLSTIEDDDDIKLRFRLKTTLGDTKTLIGSSSLSSGGWLHVAATYDGSDMKLFVNGQEDGSLPLNGAVAQNSSVPAAIGNQPQGGRGFSGLIDEVHIYTQALNGIGLQEIMGLALDPPNAAPYISDLEDTEIFVNTVTDAIPFIVGDAETAPYLLDLSVTSSNSALVPKNGIRFGGVGNNRDLTITPSPGSTGHSLITVSAYDGEYTTEETFKLTVVTPGNTAPNVSLIGDLQIVPSSSSGPIPFTVTDTSTSPGNLNVSATSSDPDLVPESGMTFGGSGTQRTLTVVPTPGESGIATITVYVDDGEYEVQETFELSIVPPVHPDLWVGLPMDEVSGSDVRDISAYKHDAKLTFGVSRAQAADHGGTLVFSGNGGQANLGNIDIPGSKFTIAAWIRPDDFGNKDARIISKATGLTDNQHYWMLSTVEAEDDTIRLRGRLRSSDGDYTSVSGDTSLSSGVWTHVAMVYNGTEIKLYVNGNLDASERFGGAVAQNSSVPAAIGDQPQGGKNFDGLIDDLKIYKTNLSKSEVQFIMTGLLGVPNAPPTITPIADMNVLVNASTVPVEFRISDVQTSPYLLNLTVSSDNTELIPPSGIILGGGGGSRTITLVPTRNTTGTANITLTISDGEYTVKESFLINVVTPGNTPPTVSPIEDVRIIPGVSTGPIPFTVNDTETSSDLITVFATATNSKLVPQSGITFGGTGANRTITINPTSQQVGTSEIVVFANDGELLYEERFELSIEPPLHPDLVVSMHFEEESGTVVYDDSPNENNGSLTAGVTRTTEGHTGSSVVFSGVGGQINLGNIDVSGTEITLAAWIRADDFGVPDARIISKASGPRDNDHFWMLSTVDGVGGTKLRMRLKTTGGDTLTIIGSKSLSPGVWTHVTGTYDGSEVRLYVNGILDASHPHKGSVVGDPSAPVAIGNHPEGGNNFDGRIDDLQVYETSFTQSQVQDLMTQSLEVPNTPPSISEIDDMYVFMNRGTGPIPFVLTDVESTGFTLSVSVSHDNPTLLPSGSVVLTGEGNYRNIAITPKPGESGEAEITISVSDGEFTTTETFILRVVTPGNTPPTITSVPNQSINFGETIASIPFSVGDAETSPGALSVTASSSNPVMVPPEAFTFGGSGANRTISIAPTSIQSGSAKITLRVGDGEMFTEESFNLTVNPPFGTTLLLGLPFEEVEGEYTYDLSPNGHSGKISGEVTRSYHGKYGRALEFSGGSGNVDLFNMDIPGRELTIATWIKPDDFGITDARIVSKANSSSLSDHYWMLSTIPFKGEVKLRMRLKTEGSSTTTIVGTKTIPAGEWTHVAATYDGSLLRLYFNGELDIEMSHYGRIATNAGVPVVIGDQPQGGRNFDGLIDDFRIYTQALDAEKVRNIMNEPLVDVGPINIPPTITNVDDQEVFQGQRTGKIYFDIGDAESDSADLVVKATSSDPNLVRANGFILGGEGDTRELTIVPSTTRSGTAIVSLTVDDGQDTVTESFILEVKRPTGGAGWWNPNWEYRAKIEVSTNGFGRGETYADVPVNFTTLLNDMGRSANIDPNTVRVVEVDAGGHFLDDEVPSQFDPDPDYDGSSKATGTLVIKLTGTTPEDTSRYYQVYFTPPGSGATAPNLPNEITVTENVLDEGQLSFRINTPNGVLFYHKFGAGFSSWVDKDGNDWIDYHPTGEFDGNYRGIPQQVHGGQPFHPGDTQATSTLRSVGPVKATIHSITNNGIGECIWEIYGNYMRFTVLAAGEKYWFLYEGAPGGSLDLNTDYLTRPDGRTNTLGEEWAEDLPDEEWMYITDPDVGRSIFFASDQENRAIDTYAPLRTMTVLGFGREKRKEHRYLTEIPHRFTMGLVDQKSLTSVSASIRSAHNDLVSTISLPQIQSESNNAPSVVISSPLSGFAYTEDDQVTFTATANDVEDGNVAGSIRWRSDRDGALSGSGNTIKVSSLSVGTHEIFATAKDSAGLGGTRSVTITINPNSVPNVEVTLPSNGSTYIQGEQIFFTASAIDFEDGNITPRIRWYSSIDGAIGSQGGSTSVSNLSPGNHTIAANATDSGGVLGTDTVNITVAAPSTRPTVAINSPANKAFYTQGQTINFAAIANDAEDGSLTSKITWKSDIDGKLTGSGGSINVSNLTAGIHNITATAMDSGLLPGQATIQITVGVVSTPPTVTITTPNGGSSFNKGDNIGFRAVATDVEDGSLTSSIIWKSNIDGTLLGTGGAIFNSTLSVGEHTITATATDAGYLPGSASVKIVVAQKSTPADVNITSPSDGAFVSLGSSVNFTATADDAEDGNLTSTLKWRSNRDGALPGSGGSITAPSLSEGIHTISATAVDSGLLPSTDTIDVYVGTLSEAPVVEIIAPEDSSFYDQGDVITFVANAVDAENGDLTTRITWSSDLDGPIGDVGGTLAISSLSVGVHTITATAVDTGFVPGFDSVEVVVRAVSFPPAVVITNPSDGSSVNQGSAVSFTASASDIEDGDLTSKLKWNSSIDGQIGTGGSFNTTSLSVGVHTITASAADSGLLPGEDTVRITVRAASTQPSVSISSPARGTFFTVGDLITMQATATDVEDGNVTGTITWTSDLDGPIPGNGGSVSTTALSVGIHRLTATAIDSGFQLGSASLRIAVSEESNAPVVVIMSPADGAFVSQGDPITFVADGIDADDGDVTDSITWSSDRDGNLTGTGGSLTTSTLSVGTHIITAQGIDSGFLPGRDSIRFTVRGVSAAPVVTINTPFDETTFSHGQMIDFTATATDAEDGDVANALVWTSSIDGVLGSGPSVATPVLSVGTHTITASTVDSGLQPGAATISVTILPLIGQFVSDDFTDELLDPEVWEVVDPVGDGQVSVNGGALVIELPEGSDHDVWTNGNLSTRVMQDVFDTDFELQVRFTSPMGNNYQMQGFLIEQDEDNFLRFDFIRFPSVIKAYSASFVGTTPTAQIDQRITFSDNYYIRVNRTGDVWTMHYSLDGEAWVLAGRYRYEIEVDKVGIYAGNASGEDSPPFTLVADYVYNTAVPVYQEDSQIEIISSGQGTVQIDEEKEYYGANEEVTLTAIPEEGWEFDGWAGDIAETENPLSLTMTEDIEIYALFFPTDGRPIIDIWYGDRQKFGAWGIPQGQANILGNVIISEQIESLSYSFNGVEMGDLSMGLEDNIRLARPGDFNIEIPFTDLNEGDDNVVKITAVGFDGAVYEREVVVESTIYNVWPRPYAIDWSQVSRIDDVAQVVDGKWEIVAGGVRSVEPHYDRLIAIGDLDWTDYEVTVPITINSVDYQPPPNEPLVGLMLRWDGHEKNFSEEQPGTEWRPIGAMGVHGWYVEGPRGGHHFQIFETGSKKYKGYNGESMPDNTTYYFKFRVETIDGRPAGLYSMKVWPAGQLEPSGWGIVRQADEGGLVEGSLMLVAHYVDATFGNIVVSSLEDNANPTVEITSPSSGFLIEEGAPLTLTAVADDFEDGELTDEIIWRSSLDGPIEGVGGMITTSDLSMGKHIITAAVVDGDSAPNIDTVNITVGINTPPSVAITNPENGYGELSGYPISFSATADDIDQGDVSDSIVWVSNVDGPITVTGGSIFAPVFSLGTHEITATATDAGGLTGSDKITVVIAENDNKTPTVDLTSPSSGGIYKEGDPIGFTAVASDVEDGTLTSGIVWSSDVDGILPVTGGSVSISGLSVGVHRISASSTDSGYFTGSDSIRIEIDANIPPSVSITAPVSGTEYVLGDTVSMTAFSVDTEEGDLTSDLTWSSSIDGELGLSGGSVSTADLSVGKHKVFATVTDSVGATVSDEIDVTVLTPKVPVTSDDFAGDDINRNLWTFVDPVGDSGYGVTQGILQLFVTGGTEHDIWNDGNQSVRVHQRVNNEDFGMEAKFVSTPTRKYQYHGVTIEQDSYNFIRFDIMSTGDELRVFGANFVNGNPTVLFNHPMSVGRAYYLNVQREGNQFTLTFATHGKQWQEAITFDRGFNVNKVDVHAGNAEGSSSPAYTALVDYFFNTASPIDPQDEGGINTAPAVEILKPAGGSVFKIGQEIFFEGSAIDAETGNLSSSLFWKSDLNGDLPGEGEIISNRDLQIGTHLITASATDLDSATGSDSITIEVREEGPLVSDNFNTDSLNTNLWTFVDPVGDSDYSMENGAASINLDAGSTHDVWASGNQTARLMQNVTNSDFGMEAGFSSALTERFQLQGITIEEDEKNFIRLDFVTSGTSSYVFAASFVDDVPTAIFNKPVGSYQNYFLRVVRERNIFNMFYSFDGNNWLYGGSFARQMNVTRLGVHAGNAPSDNGEAPAFSSKIDYVDSLD